MKQNIAIDFDDVIVQTAEDILDELGLFFNEVYDINMLTSYNISKVLGIKKEIVQDAIDVTLTNYFLPPEKDSIKVIKWLSNLYDIHIVTSRQPEFIEYVEQTIRNYKLNDYITDIHSSNIKSSILRKINAKVFIEDNPVYITEACRYNLLYSKPWNVKVNNSLLVQRVNNWKEVKDWFILKIGSESKNMVVR